jgi:axial budding pattern protein 2
MLSFFNISPLLLGSISLAYAIPQLSFPINAQVPPLAVVGQPFSFTFSLSTFSYYTPSLTYSISNNTPSWLTFDASTGTFGGTPASGDVGNFTFNLTAKDTSGSAVDNVNFIVVQDDGVTIGEDVKSQLGGFGGVDGNGGIVLNNEKGFSWQFSQDTFKTDGVSIQTYYAVSAGIVFVFLFLTCRTYAAAKLD